MSAPDNADFDYHSAPVRAETILRTVPAHAPNLAEKLDCVQHVKRGSAYEVIGRGMVQSDTPLTDYAEVVVYRGLDDGLIWVRPVSEFDDGRFAPIAEIGGAA